MKKPVLFLLMLLLLFLISCAPRQPKVIEPDFFKGFNGLEINFVSGNPPNEIIFGQNYQVGVELRNKGGYDITNGFLSLGGFNSQISEIRGEGTLKRLILAGRSFNFPEGEIKVENFEVSNKKRPEAVDFELYTITACYQYKTVASAEVCAGKRKSRYSPGECQIKDLSFSGQGAPVGITKIEENVITRKQDFFEENEIQFVLHIANKGKGDVISSDSYAAACGYGGPGGAVNKGIVRISNSLLGNDIALECNPGEIKIEKGKEATVNCKAVLGQIDGNYNTFLNIELDYGYVQSINRNVKIKR